MKLKKPWPEKLGPCIDLAVKRRRERQALQRQIDELKKEEGDLKATIIAMLRSDKLASGRGRLATATISPRTVAEVEDWNEFYEYIRKKKAFDMLQRRVNDKAYRERLDANEVVPGVKPYTYDTLSLTSVDGGSDEE